MAVQEHTRDRNKLPTIWLAKVGNNGLMTPVRMEIASDFGTVIAHLSRVSEGAMVSSLLNKKETVE